MTTGMSLAHFWNAADWISRTAALLLLAQSVTSWYVVGQKACAHLRFRARKRAALDTFWSANSLAEALAGITALDRSRLLAAIADAGVQAAQVHARQSGKSIGGTPEGSVFLAGVLRQRIVECQAKVEQGLTFLASVGATAPFIGLFGTVWGIYHALLGLSGASQVVLDKVAGPVGEALVMTGAGLLVAVPAVLAYNGFVRANRLVMMQIDGFAHDLHAYLTTGIRLRTSGEN